MKFYKLFLSVFVILLAISHQALAYNIEGIIKDYDGELLVDAMVRILNEQRFERGKDFTNRSGEYSIHGLPAGNYTLEIEKVGMKKVEEKIALGGHYYEQTTYKDINLSEIVRFESVKESEMKGLYVLDESTIPRGAFSRYRKGLKKLKKNNLDGALKEFQKAVEKHETFSRCYTHMGEIYSRLSKSELAVENFNKAIEFNSDDPLPRTGMGKHYCNLEKWADARTQLEKASAMDPGRAENHFLLGEALYSLNEKSEAEKELIQGLMIQPRESGNARILLANLFIEQERWTDALSMLKNYLRENPFAENKQEIKTRIKEIEQQIALYSLPPME